MSYWYLAHADELLIDLDDYMRPTKSGCPWGEAFFRRRLRNAIRDKKIKVRDVYLYSSSSTRHYHAIIRLNNFRFYFKGGYRLSAYHPLAEIYRLIWQLHLGGDLYRGRCDLMRSVFGMHAPSLLITSKPFQNFYRPPDRICPCTTKHDTEVQFALGSSACPVWRELRGMSPWELFGENRKLKEKFVPLPIGRVPLDLIMRQNIDES